MIEVDNLTKKFGRLTALDAVSFQARPGEIVGLLGPNGAGKSTAMRLITTFLLPDSGRVRVGGHAVDEEPLAVRRLIGYLPEVAPLYPDMWVAQYLDFVARARGLGRADRRRRADWVVEKCGLAPVWRQPAGELSLGYRQRVGLAQALIHDPPVLVLDEPTGGLDPFQIIGIRELIRELGKTKTIIFSTHILPEAAAVCRRLVILSGGRVAARGTLAQLEARARGEPRLRFAVQAPRQAVRLALERLEGVSDSRCLDEESGETDSVFLVQGPDEARLAERLAGLAASEDWPVRELAPARLSLEEVFLALAGDKPGPEGGGR